jgi:hypothetical protein
MDESFSSLLLRVLLPVPSSMSPPRPESRLAGGMGDVCVMVLSGEPPCWGVGRPWKVKASKPPDGKRAGSNESCGRQISHGQGGAGAYRRRSMHGGEVGIERAEGAGQQGGECRGWIGG